MLTSQRLRDAAKHSTLGLLPSPAVDRSIGATAVRVHLVALSPRVGQFCQARPGQFCLAPKPDGSQHIERVGQEKGIDVRIALDMVQALLSQVCDVVLLFSQDQDLSEVAKDVRKIAQQQGRWIKIASAFPVGAGTRNSRGVNDTDWIKVERATYDACIDPWVFTYP